MKRMRQVEESERRTFGRTALGLFELCIVPLYPFELCSDWVGGRVDASCLEIY